MNIRDRILRLDRIPAKDLLQNPKNWRRHSKGQSDALRGILADIGYASALVAREIPAKGKNGKKRLMLIDGHLRAETTPETKVPVLVLDVTEAEANKLLATMDPLGAMAECDHAALALLLAGVSSDDEGLKALLESLRGVADLGASVDGFEKKAQEAAANATDQDGWPMIEMQVPPAVKDRFEALLGAEEGEHPWQRLSALLNRVAPS